MTTATEFLPPAADTKKRKISGKMWLLIALGVCILISIIRVWTDAPTLTSKGLTEEALKAAVPIALAGLAGLWSERAGVINIGLEGMMVFGTFGAGWAGANYGPWAAVGFGIALGMVGGLLHALATITFGVDHIISGVAINIIAPALTVFLAKIVFATAGGGVQRTSGQIADLPRITVPGLSQLLDTLEQKQWFLISDVSGILRGLTTDVSILTVFTLFLFIGSFFILWRTRFGLRLRSTGEAPYAAESLGVNVNRYKYAAVVISGGLAGLAGAFLVIRGQFQSGQTQGRGFIGLAALIFGNYRPGGIAMGAGLFGFTSGATNYDPSGDGTALHSMLLIIVLALIFVGVLQFRRGQKVIAGVIAVIALLAGVWFFATDRVPVELANATPYVVTLLVMGLASQRLRVPKADGLIYRKGGH